MKTYFSPISWLSGAMAFGALALAGCGGGGGGNGGSTPSATATPSPSATPGPNASLQNTIVFVSSRNGSNDIYSIRSDGSNETRLTTNSAADNSPSRSRDGSRIVFSSLRDGNPEIYTMGIAGETSQLLRLTSDSAAPPADTNPVFSANGGKIAWISTRGGGSNVWIMDSTGANQTQLTTIGNVSSVAFAPNGNEVAFAATRAGASVIVSRNLASGAENVLVSGAFDALSPRYNPGGTSLVFTQRTSGGQTRRLRVLDLSSGAISDGPGQNSSATFELAGAFSPGGNQLVFTVEAAPATQIGVSTGLSGSGITTLTSQGTNFSPSWGQ